MKYFCNPLNVNYRYQFNADPRQHGRLQICREAADPSMILFKNRYYIFASMTLGVWVSDDLTNWENHRLPESLPLYDYAPDVRVLGEWVYFCASNREHNCDRWRTKDILSGPYEKIEGSFPFWDPNLFQDEDGRVYFYWGCSNQTPIYGVELDPDTMEPIGEKKELVFGDPYSNGYERIGENNSTLPASEEEIETGYRAFVANSAVPEELLPPDVKPLIRGMFSKRPYIEGAWMDKHNGKYYLQYACPGAQYNTYSDGVYIGDTPLGPFTLAENNPCSYKPGGFLPGAGHGSTMEDKQGNWWHTSTMRISVNHDFERRVGLWPAGFDADGELFCNQRYGDWPMAAEGDPWRDPAWMLLSVDKAASASSFLPGHEPEKATEENVQTWWRAATSSRDEWLCVDLGKVFDVHAVQMNFADDTIDIPCPGEIRPGSQARYIEENDYVTQWKLEGSADGESWFVIADKSAAETDLSHDLIVSEQGFKARYLRLSDMAVPYGQNPCVSGLRVFGLGDGEKPAEPVFSAARMGDLDMVVQLKEQADALGYNILFGSSPEKLYHSDLIFKAGSQRVGALIKGREYYVRVDAFNENGITEGKCVKLYGGNKMAFPQEFLIGAATAAHQVEGNNINSDYWLQEHLPHSSFTEPSGEACDHYNRYEEDIKLLAEAGLNAYRFSIEWARIEPEEGKFDETEIEHYRKVIACCKAHGVEPIVTLLHFTSPAWLIRKGGWEAESTIEYFRRYAAYVTEKLGGELNYICTINEANMGLQLAAIARRFTLMAQQAAKAKSAEGTVQVGMNFEKMMENMKFAAIENAQAFGTPQPQIFVSSRTPEGDALVFRAHQAAKEVIKALYPNIKVGITLSMHDLQALPGGESFAEAAWDEEFKHYLPFIANDDFLGVQNYTRTQYGPAGQLPCPEGAELTQMDYEFYPEALEHVIRRVHEDFKGDLIVTENGVAVSDDSRRVEFIRRALAGVESCVKDGIPVKGYMYWSLMDNFEWQKGFSMTFGLIAVDRATQMRTPKESLAFLGAYTK